MNLTPQEKLSPVWLKLEQFLTERIEICRRKNDGDLDQFETTALRGEIKALKRILALGEDLPLMEADGE